MSYNYEKGTHCTHSNLNVSYKCQWRFLMTNNEEKHDFKAALEHIEQEMQLREHPDLPVIATALRLASRLQSGEVSEGMLRVGGKRIARKSLFRAMAQQMIKEVQGE
jgi:hypothetical protein